MLMAWSCLHRSGNQSTVCVSSSNTPRGRGAHEALVPVPGSPYQLAPRASPRTSPWNFHPHPRDAFRGCADVMSLPQSDITPRLTRLARLHRLILPQLLHSITPWHATREQQQQQQQPSHRLHTLFSPRGLRVSGEEIQGAPAERPHHTAAGAVTSGERGQDQMIGAPPEALTDDPTSAILMTHEDLMLCYLPACLVTRPTDTTHCSRPFSPLRVCLVHVFP
ncbi:hypothetical protein E2C01_063233 [Portunus trituberculatus]|uniref:Uncharacterized protein n=1 Tax=Portunus trituberculatus TaxID=210409 RepID=A0A5B7HJQ7_PORTR|nr:hypothetical protein [Portunus trituberculatus]